MKDESNGIAAAQAAGATIEADGEVQWRDRSMREMITHLEHEHHQNLRGIIFHSALLLHDAVSLDSAEVLARVRHAFREFSDMLILHIEKEEHLFFPLLLSLESTRERGKPSPAAAGEVRNGVANYVAEHGAIHGSLLRLSAESAALGPLVHPAVGGLRKNMTVLERHVREYLEFEDHVVFPRAVALEDDLQRSPGTFSRARI